MYSKPTAELSSVYLDLTARGGLDKFLYEASDPSQKVESIHAREITPIAPFARGCVPLQKSGTTDQAFYTMGKTAGFIGNTKLVFKTPEISLKDEFVGEFQIAFCRNLGHNVFKRVSIYVSDVPIVHPFGPTTMDILSELNFGSKYAAYMKSIGNTTSALTFGSTIPPQRISKLMHEFWFTQSERPISRNAHPLCALESNTFQIRAEFIESLSEVIRVRKLNKETGEFENVPARSVDLCSLLNVSCGRLDMPLPEIWADYIIVTEDEKKFHKTGDARHMLIKQYQSTRAPKACGSQIVVDYRLTKPIRFTAFVAKNLDAVALNNHSNYTTNAVDSSAGDSPIDTVSKFYDNITRYANMDMAHFSQDNTLTYAERQTNLPIGYDPSCFMSSSMEVDGSLNHTKINTRFEFTISDGPSDETSCAYSIEVIAENFQVVTIKDGALNFPTY